MHIFHHWCPKIHLLYCVNISSQSPSTLLPFRFMNISYFASSRHHNDSRLWLRISHNRFVSSFYNFLHILWIIICVCNIKRTDTGTGLYFTNTFFFAIHVNFLSSNSPLFLQILKIEAKFLNQDFMISERVHEITRQILSLIYFAVGVTLITLFGAMIVTQVRNPAGSWTFDESFYFAFATITTIGYGDLPLEGDDMMLFLTVYMVCTVTISTVFIEKVGICLYQFREYRKRDKIDKMVISARLLRKFNPSGKVNALEFLVGMLTYGDVIDKEKNIDPILRKFLELDTNNTG